jgi:hypothetical protein
MSSFAYTDRPKIRALGHPFRTSIDRARAGITLLRAYVVEWRRRVRRRNEHAALRETERQIAEAERRAEEEREAKWRASFRPSAYLLGEESRPSQITIYGISGGAERWLRIPLDLSRPPVTFAAQALAVARCTKAVPFHGAAIVARAVTHSPAEIAAAWPTMVRHSQTSRSSRQSRLISQMDRSPQNCHGMQVPQKVGPETLFTFADTPRLAWPLC